MGSKDVALMAHLMRRAGFGAPYEELEARAAKGYEATVEELLDPDSHGIPPVDLHIFRRYHPLAEAEASTEKSALTFIYYLLTTQRTLEEKMTLLWHMIFATGNSKVENSREMVGVDGPIPYKGCVVRRRLDILPTYNSGVGGVTLSYGEIEG